MIIKIFQVPRCITVVFLAIVSVIFLVPSSSKADVRGSTVLVSVEPYFEFPASPLLFANRMEAFGWFKNGFGLEDATTECDFASVFPVGGNVELNGGLLLLESDLVFQPPASIVSTGIFDAQSHAIDLSPSVTYLPSGHMTTIKDACFFFNDDLHITGTVLLQGTCVVDGRGNNLILDSGSQVVIASNANVEFSNLIIDKLAYHKFYCADDSSSIKLNNIRLLLDDDYTFTNGSITFCNDVSVFGKQTFAYHSHMTSTVASDATFLITDDSSLCIGRVDGIDGREPLFFEDKTSRLELDNATLIITDSGMRVTRGSIVLNKNTVLDLNSTSQETGFSIGDGTPTGDMKLQVNAGATIYLGKGHFTYANSVTDAFEAKTKNTRITIEDGFIFHQEGDLILKNLTAETIAGWTMVQTPGKSLSFEDYLVVLPGSSFEINVKWFDQAIYLLDGDKNINVIGGLMPLASVIAGTGNVIQGLGGVSGPIIFSHPGAELTLGILGGLTTDVTFGDGVIALTQPLSLRNGALLNGSGTVNLSDQRLTLEGRDILWTGTTTFDGNRGVVQLDSNIALSSTWTFSGDNILDGRGGALDLRDAGNIVVERGSCLTIKNLKIENSSDDRIRCLDDAAKIIFDNVMIMPRGDSSFDKGSLAVKNIVDLCGNIVFTYQSAMPSTILASSTLILERDVTFSINSVAPRRDILTFENDLSTLRLNGASLYVTATGLQLTKGILLVDQYGSLQSEVRDVGGVTVNQGFDIGNGNAEDDFSFEILVGSELDLKEGLIRHKNSDASEWVLHNPYSVLRLYPYTRLILDKTLNLNPGRLFVHETAQITSNNAAVLNGSVSFFSEL